MLKEFKDFILKGNLVEIAVGLILALAFKGVVDAFVNGIISPLIGAVLGAPSFADKVLTIGDGEILYGAFISEVISFVIVGFILFLIVKAYNKAVEITKRGSVQDEEDATAEEILLLREIRDQLASRD